MTSNLYIMLIYNINAYCLEFSNLAASQVFIPFIAINQTKQNENQIVLISFKEKALYIYT